MKMIFFKNNAKQLKEGDVGAYGIVVLSLFLILKCGTAVSFSHEVYSFSPFWLTVFGKRRSFTVLRYCSVHSLV